MTTPYSFTLAWNFLSDWHVGSGLETPGSYDQNVQRDSHNLPFLPAKTQTGIFRDSAEEVRDALGPAWSGWFRWLLGDESTQGQTPEGERPLQSPLSIRPAHLPPSLADRLGSHSSFQGAPELAESLFFPKAGVKLDDQGQAEDGCLRLIEMCRGNLTLTSQGTLDVEGLSEIQAQTALHLIALVVFNIKRVGANRRRGAGHVEVSLDHGSAPVPTATELAAWLEKHETPPAETPAPVEQMPAIETARQRGDDWVRLPFRLHVQSPVLATERIVGNVVRTLDFIPGTLLLPALARVLRSHGLEGEIGAGNIRVSPATLEIDGKPGLPVPAALFHPKEGAQWFNTTGQVSNRLVDLDNPEHAKDFRQGYLTEPEPGLLPRFQAVHTVIRPHNTVEDQSQRPTREVGGVFSYEAIAPGQFFRGEVMVRRSLAEALPEVWWKPLAGPVALGRSKKDDYGQANLVWLGEPQPNAPAAGGKGASGKLTVWLTSDTLLLDAFHRPATTANDLREALARQLSKHGVEVTGPADHSEDSYLYHRRLESWHVGWGLPRPSLVAIRAGSCLKLQFKGNLDAQALKAIESEGIGLRRAEGFGRIKLEPGILTEPMVTRQPPAARLVAANPAPGLIQLGDTCFEVARELEKACWRRRIRIRVVEVAGAPENRKAILGFQDSAPGASQVGLARAVVRQPGPRTAAGELVKKAESKTRAEERGNLWQSRLKQLIESSEEVWKFLGAHDWPVLTENGRETLKSNLNEEAVRSLVDAVARAHVRSAQARHNSNSSVTGAQTHGS